METLKYVLLVFYYFFREIVLCFVPKSWRLKSIKKEIVLINGAGNSLGKALAIKLAGHVSHLVLWDTDEKALQITSRLIKQQGGQSTYYVVDVSNYDSVVANEKKVRREVGLVTILVNNTSVIKGRKFETLRDEDIVKTFQMNTYSVFWTHKVFLPQMMEANKGHLVIIGDASSLVSCGQHSDYAASKAAVGGLFESLALEVKDAGYDGIEFTFVCPYFMTNKSSKTAKSKENDNYHVIADSIVEAIRDNREMVVMPKWLYVYDFFARIMPLKSSYMLYKALGGFETCQF